jgi:hypothetical protein
MPKQVETICQIPDEPAQLYPALYANGPDLYHQSSWGCHLWKVSPVGEFTEVVTLETRYSEASAVTRQCVFTPTLKSLTSCNFQDFRAYLPNGDTIPYFQLLGKPCLFYGGGILDGSDPEEQTQIPEAENGRAAVRLLREYRTDRGDYAAEILVSNGNSSPLQFSSLVIDFTAGKLSLNRYFRMPSGPNTDSDSGYCQLKPGASQVYTFVVPAEMMAKAGAFTDVKLSAELLRPHKEPSIFMD